MGAELLNKLLFFNAFLFMKRMHPKGSKRILSLPEAALLPRTAVELFLPTLASYTRVR